MKFLVSLPYTNKNVFSKTENRKVKQVLFGDWHPCVEGRTYRKGVGG
jgi:hypothetical protein